VPGKRSRVGKLQSKHYNDWIAFGFEDVVFEACRDANALRAAGLIRHDATTCRLPQRYAVEDLTASGVECQKIAVESCSEDQSGSRDRDPCDYRLGRFTAPADNAVVRIDGGDPAFLTLVFLAESICRTEKRLELVSTESEVQTEPPPIRTPFGQVSAPGALPVGANANVHTTRPVAPSNPATMQPHARSAPDVPMNTIPFQATGEAAMVAGLPSVSASRVAHT